jgi:hypothetical protein
MFLRDLEPYRYGLPASLKDVVAVGWLSRISSYPQGEVTDEFVEALAQLLSSHRVNQMRGYHVCESCSKSPLMFETQSGRTMVLGSAEIWVPSPEEPIIFAAPDLIYHYVKEHRYLPPSGFITAVVSASQGGNWDANSECEKRLEAAFRN